MALAAGVNGLRRRAWCVGPGESDLLECRPARAGRACFENDIDLNTADDTLRQLRRGIPSFDCIPGCHDCCGPVTASSIEMARLPRKSAAVHEAALAELSCPHLGADGCEVYDERPLICRLFGTTASLPCPHGRGPKVRTDAVIEHRVHWFARHTRQVLV